jgi:hypothetical protein
MLITKAVLKKTIGWTIGNTTQLATALTARPAIMRYE